METVLTLINIASAALAVLAAIAWIISAHVTVVYNGKAAIRPPGPSLPNPALLYGANRRGQQIDLIPTLKKQSQWNSRAAWLAAGAALLQAMGTFCATFPLALDPDAHTPVVCT